MFPVSFPVATDIALPLPPSPSTPATNSSCCCRRFFRHMQRREMERKVLTAWYTTKFSVLDIALNDDDKCFVSFHPRRRSPPSYFHHRSILPTLSTMVATTPQPRINLESLFDSNDNINHRFRFIVDGNNHRFRFIIVECYFSNGKSRPCRQNLPLHFSPLHVSERSTATLILQRALAVRVGVEVQYPLQGGDLPEERELRNFNSRDLSEIKWYTIGTKIT